MNGEGTTSPPFCHAVNDSRQICLGGNSSRGWEWPFLTQQDQEAVALQDCLNGNGAMETW